MIEGGSKGDDLRMGRGIHQPLGLVMPPRNDGIVHDNDGPDRNLILRIRPAGFFQRMLHVKLVVHGGIEDKPNKKAGQINCSFATLGSTITRSCSKSSLI